MLNQHEKGLKHLRRKLNRVLSPQQQTLGRVDPVRTELVRVLDLVRHGYRLRKLEND
jgi:hypothetical protein